MRPLSTVDAGGNVLVVWNVYSPTAYRSTLLATRFEKATGNWQPVSANGYTASFSISTQLAGDTLLASMDTDPAQRFSALRATRYHPEDNTWSPVANSPQPGLRKLESPVVSTNAAGQAIAVWGQNYSGEPSAVYSSFLAGESWGPQLLLSDAPPGIGPGAAPPRIRAALDAAGNAVCLVNDPHDGILRRRTLAAGAAAWSSAEDLGPASGFSVSVDRSGTFFVAWFDGALQTQRLTGFNGSWISMNFPRPLPNNASPLGLVGDGFGNAVAYADWNSATYYDATTATWSEQDFVLGSHDKAVQFSFDRRGNGILVWGASNDQQTSYQEKYSRYVLGQGWSTSGEIPSNPLDYPAPPTALAIDESGEVTVAWQRMHGSTFELLASRFR
jgi:hypothetical protein